MTGGAGEPYSVYYCTRLGWSLSGPVNNIGGRGQSSHCIVSHGRPELLGQLGTDYVVNPDPVVAEPTPYRKF